MLSRCSKCDTWPLSFSSVNVTRSLATRLTSTLCGDSPVNIRPRLDHRHLSTKTRSPGSVAGGLPFERYLARFIRALSGSDPTNRQHPDPQLLQRADGRIGYRWKVANIDCLILSAGVRLGLGQN